MTTIDWRPTENPKLAGRSWHLLDDCDTYLARVDLKHGVYVGRITGDLVKSLWLVASEDLTAVLDDAEARLRAWGYLDGVTVDRSAIQPG